MANKFKVKRGTNLSNISTAPEAGELIYKTDTNELFIGDGSTAASSLTAIGGTGTVDTSGTPVANEYARFTDANTIEGRSYAAVRNDLGLNIGSDVQAYDTLLQDIADLSLSNPTQDGYVLAYNDTTAALELVEQSGGISFNGSTANGLLTYGSSTTADVESELTYSAGTLQINRTSGNAVLQIRSDDSNPRIYFKEGSTTRANLGYSISNNRFELYNGSSTPFSIEDGAGNNTLVVDSNSRVGIGTAGPGRQLHLSGEGVIRLDATSADPGLDFNTAGTSDMQIRYRAASDKLQVYSYGTSSNVMTIQKSDGNIGIATESPANRVHILGNANNAALRVQRGDSPGQNLYFRGYQMYNAGNHFLISAADGNELRLGHVSSTAQLVLDSSGNISTGVWQGTAIDAAYIANLPASKITSGAFDVDRLPTAAVTNGDINNVSTADAIYDFVTGQGYLTSVPNHSASLITSGTLNNARLNTDMQLSAAAPRYKLQETGVTNTPVWWMIADGGNYSIRLNNTGTYPLTITTNGENSAVSSITLGYNTSITGSLEINNRFTSTGTGGFTIGNYAGRDRIQNSSNSFSFLTDANAYANMTFGTVTAGTWNGSVIASAYLDADTAHLSGTQTFTGAKTFTGRLTISDAGADGLHLNQDTGANTNSNRLFFTGNSGSCIMQEADDLSFRTGATAGSSSGTERFKVNTSGTHTVGNITVSGTVDGRDIASDGSKLDGIESGATADQTASEILTAIKTVDGSGSGLDADLLDGLHGSSYWSKSGSWVGDLASNGYSRVQGVSNGGGEFVLALKSGQLHTLVDGSYIAYEASSTTGGGFWSSYNSAYGNASGFKASANDKIRVQQLDGGTADLEVTGNIKLTNERGLLWDYTPNTGLGGYIAHPGGGMYRTSTGTHTGALTIIIPTGGGPADMISFWVDVFDYVSYESQSFYIAGYVYQTAGSNEWVNETAMMLTPKENHARTVRFGHNGTNHVVYIGELADTWSYPQVTVRNVQVGYASDVDAYNDNWDISFEASAFQNVDATYTGADTLPTAGKIKMKDGAGKFVHNTTSSRDKIRVWNSNNYAIGMQSGFTFGGLENQYAMTFQMNNQSTERGFWWGDDGHGQGNGAMALTTAGELTVAHSLRLGYGESDTTTPGATYRLDVSGSIGATADVVAYISSDKRLKDNIKNIENPLEKLQKLNGIEFDWNDKQDLYKGHDIGVIAQEVEEVLPEIVDTREDGHKAVKYDRMVALLIEVAKEQQKQINELKEKLNG